MNRPNHNPDPNTPRSPQRETQDFIRVLITGVTGFVGSNLVAYFHSGKDVIVFGHSRDSTAANEQFKNASIEIISTLSAVQIDALKIDCIIHLAGIAHDLSNRYVERDYEKVNFEDTAFLYDQFLNSNAKMFVYLSSIKAAVDSASQPVNETVQPAPVTPYGKSKLKAEQYIQSRAIPLEKNYYILRPCMIHGPNNKGNLNLLYRFVKSGIPYPLGAFHNKRSFLSMDNLAFMMDRIIHTNLDSGIYNLSDEGSLSTREVVSIIASALGNTARIWNLPMVPITQLFRWFGRKELLDKMTESMEVSNAKILAALNAPLPVSMAEGLRRTIRSFHE